MPPHEDPQTVINPSPNDSSKTIDVDSYNEWVEQGNNNRSDDSRVTSTSANKDMIEAKNAARKAAEAQIVHPRAPQAGKTSNVHEGATGRALLNHLDKDIETKNKTRDALLARSPAVSANPKRLSAANYKTLEEGKLQARPRSGPALIPGAFEEVNKAPRTHPGKSVDVENPGSRSGMKPELIAFDDEEQPGQPGSKGLKPSALRLIADLGDECYDGKNAKDGKASLPVFVPNYRKDDMKSIELKKATTTSTLASFSDFEDLAVAKPVDDEELGDEYIPDAIEFDPDNKPGDSTKRSRLRVYGFVTTIVIAVSIALVMLLVKSEDEQQSLPSSAPSTFRESLGIQEHIERVMGTSNVQEENSPHSKALDWIINEDPMQLSVESDRLVQRFVLALFYFQTTQNGPWRSCNPPVGNETSDCMYKKLVSIWPEMLFDEIEWVRWLSDAHECEWTGVDCENELVTTLELRAHELSGSFPTEISHLPYLSSIVLSWNNFNGTLPIEFASQSQHLTNIELHHNQISGTLPPEWFTFKSLLRMNIGGNPLTGTLPSAMNLPDLKGLFLFESQISGTIPPTFYSDLPSLSFARLSKTNLEGPLSTEIGKLTNLQELWFHKSKMFGTIPSEIGNLQDLRDFRIQYNRMTGRIPESLFSLPMISRIDLWNNQFSGPIDSSIGGTSSLTVFRAMNNSLTGTIPTEMGLLTQLRQVWLEHNHFDGSVPDEVCIRRNSTIMELSTDCLQSNLTGLAQVKCESGCCTKCCLMEEDAPTCIYM